MQLVLNTHGLVLKVKQHVFYVSAGDERRMISPEQVTSIAVTAPCMMSSAAIALAADAGIPIYFYDRIGEAQSCLRSPYFESLATLRRKQVYFSDAIEGGSWVVEQFRHKTLHQVQVLEYLAHRKKKAIDNTRKSIKSLQARLKDLPENGKPSNSWNASLMGWEGMQAKYYWQAIAQCLDPPWTFPHRSRRPAKDPFNAMVNYLYGMLYSITEQALFAAGLDPHLGILHADEYDRPTLSYDLIEAFRPWVDRLILEKITQGEIENNFFEPIESGIYLSDNGKRFLIPAFNSWMQQAIRWQSRQQSREAHIYRTAAQLARTINETQQRP